MIRRLAKHINTEHVEVDTETKYTSIVITNPQIICSVNWAYHGELHMKPP